MRISDIILSTVVAVLAEFVVVEISVVNSMVVVDISVVDSVVMVVVVNDSVVVVNNSAVVAVVSSVVVTSLVVVVDIVGKLGCRGTVDIPRLMMVCSNVLSSSGAKVGAFIPN